MFNIVRSTLCRFPYHKTVDVVARCASTARDGVYRMKPASKIWLGDAGAYPIMVAIGGILGSCTGVGLYYMVTSPDVRLWGQSRSHPFRGSVGSDYHK